MIRNQAGQTVSFQAVNITTGAPVTTGTPVVYITIGGVQAPSTNTAAHAGNGEWELDLTAAETNGASVAFTFTLTNAINQTLNAYPVTLADYQADVSGLSTFDASTDTVTTDTASRDASKADVSGLSTFDPDTDTVANVTTVATCTTNTDMRGTDSAFLATSAPANFSSLGINVSGHVSRVTLVDTTTTNSDMRGTDGANTVAPDNTSIAAILVDTNDLQTNQGNWLTADLTGVQTTVDDTNADLESFISDTATNFNSLDSKITTVDGVVDAILVDTDELQSKLIPMLEADGSGGFQYTALALENAPSGGGGPGGPGDATEAKQDQIIATLAGIEGTGFDTLTDSLEAIRDRGDAA